MVRRTSAVRRACDPHHGIREPVRRHADGSTGLPDGATGPQPPDRIGRIRESRGGRGPPRAGQRTRRSRRRGRRDRGDEVAQPPGGGPQVARRGRRGGRSASGRSGWAAAVGVNATSTQKFIPEPLTSGKSPAELYTPSPPDVLLDSACSGPLRDPAAVEVPRGDAEVAPARVERDDVDRVGLDRHRAGEVDLLPAVGASRSVNVAAASRVPVEDQRSPTWVYPPIQVCL